jgi:hypothetical protein
VRTLATPAQTTPGNWRELYIAALFETDNRRIPLRIADAEKAIVSRARELFSAGGDTIEEDQALSESPCRSLNPSCRLVILANL